jgi:branched-chain amino acid transport system ATP-binding protein
MDVLTQVESRTSHDPTNAPMLLDVRDVEVVYNDVILVLRSVGLQVGVGEVVALLGANGAGKTTLLRAVTGLLAVHRGKITKGEIRLGGLPITAESPAGIVRAGIAQVMEGRRVFAPLTVDENLRMGAISRRDRGEITANYERVMLMFPKLADRRRQQAGYLSGGEQQMLAIGRALMASPRLLVLDEPSLGLAPLIVEQIREILVDIHRSGTSVLLVEQNATMALSIAAYGYIMETGRVVRSGPAADLLADADIQEFYLGVGEAGRKSFRDVKTYRRARRW